ncbi:hypothetical protein CVD28_00970 [Bacillus sp. M6-12]|uniref:hypothetical protein n=1 Tax=Bacillus sp. M6-12 TaxID=2054166 RepID=UPI000C76677C|nr:hypothetical protein [Bacillus sp. M6-12]PLS19005.1 hypothetical protein CVD28_00970 [Bacillus sp. M6-12]
MYLEEGTIYRVNCGEKVEVSQFAETVLLLVNQKSSNRTSGILDVETIYGTNDILVTVLNSVCEYKMNDYLKQFGEVTTENIVLGIENNSEQRFALERGEEGVDNLDKAEGRKFIKQLKNEDEDYISYRGFVVED